MRRQLALVATALLPTLAALPAAAAPAARSFTIAATGDIIVHRAIADAARIAPGRNVYDFRPLLLPIEPWISDADFALCHLEGTLSPTNTGLLYQHEDEHPAYFNGPHEMATALMATGYDACSTAGNHALDRGLTGVTETLEVLDAAGLGHAGTGRDNAEREPVLYQVNGVRVAHLAYTQGTNEPRPTEAPWAVNVIDRAAILADARRAREQGAEFIMVSLHWGTEYQQALDTSQTSLAAALTASPDIDLILGHHTHLVQSIARVNGKVVAYGLGNLLSNIRTAKDGTKAGSEDGVIVHLRVEETENSFTVTEVTVTPTWVDWQTKRALPVEHTLAYGEGAVPTAALQASRAHTLRRAGTPTALSPTPWPSLVCAGRVASLVGTAGPDVLMGTPGDDVIVGRGGGDIILGGEGDDLICGGNGADLVWGGPGADSAYGDHGDDLLSGGDGPDTLHGGSGADRLGGGESADSLYGGAGDDLLSGQAGGDVLEAGPGRDLLRGGTGADTLAGLPGDRLQGDAADSCRVIGVVAPCE
ncbi:MAG: CapA family protein [Acidimicrobiia bacterium]|nr:CapA family protein [Acidimicrobiia bacterium]